ncbi:nucleosome assembly protein 1-like 4-like [Scleropages formosus]|uniref:Nucleosome assembly protein 1-like 4-like n=1 Tax=Scleropages formosus TaxID=113540 RepID=A0A0P7X7F3_SCLFO|nr:nucleosome assembly protein 1-like 4-like [Scleropages formosus]
MDGGKNETRGKVGSQAMEDPQALAALQDSVLHSPATILERRARFKFERPDYFLPFPLSLPKSVKRRVNALKQLQVRCAHTEAKFYEEVHELERKYASLYQPLFDKRRDVITGTVEPTDAECEWRSDHEEEEELSEELKKKACMEETKEAAPSEEDPKGIPEFWLTIFKNVDMLGDLLQEHDEPILKHLQDIKVKFSEPGQPMSFTLEFHFEPNSYFTNTVLTKVYKMKSEPDREDPFSFEGPEIIDCEGCEINWNKGKDVTVKTIKKKQKHKGRGTVRTITKTVPNDSFFNFFNPIKDQSVLFPSLGSVGDLSMIFHFIMFTNLQPCSLNAASYHEWPEEVLVVLIQFVLCKVLAPGTTAGDFPFKKHGTKVAETEMDEDSEFTLAADFEIGHFFRERIVPRAVLYFTGEALEDDDSVSLKKRNLRKEKRRIMAKRVMKMMREIMTPSKKSPSLLNANSNDVEIPWPQHRVLTSA